MDGKRESFFPLKGQHIPTFLMIRFPCLRCLVRKKSLWFFPLISEDDLDNITALRGLDFPTRSDVEA